MHIWPRFGRRELGQAGVLQSKLDVETNSTAELVVLTVSQFEKDGRATHSKTVNPDFISQNLPRVPHLRGFHYRRSHYRDFWLMYEQAGDFCVRKPSTVPLANFV